MTTPAPVPPEMRAMPTSVGGGGEGRVNARRVEQIGDATLYLGDARDVLPTLGRVDAVVTDPPFSIPVKYQDSEKSWFRSWGDMLSMEPWAKQWLSACVSLVREHGQMYICCDEQSYPIFFKASLDLMPQSHLLIWYKPTGRRGRGWMRSYELVIHLARPQTVYAAGFRQDVIGIMPVRTLNREHPAEKPGDLIEFISEGLTPDHNTILDPFMGSGTTGVTCLRHGRKFIGIEIEPRYFDIACRRIDAESRKPRLPGIDEPKPKQVSIFEHVRFLPHGQEAEPGEAVKPLAGHHGHYSRLAVRQA